MSELVTLEAELSEQIQQQRSALIDVTEVLVIGASEELRELKAQLEDAISQLEEALLEIKRTQLLSKLEAFAEGRNQNVEGCHARQTTASGRNLDLEPGASCRWGCYVSVQRCMAA